MYVNRGIVMQVASKSMGKRPTQIGISSPGLKLLPRFESLFDRGMRCTEQMLS